MAKKEVEKKKDPARIQALAIQEVVGSGGFTSFAAQEKDQEVQSLDKEDLPEGVEVEEETTESVKLRDPYTNQETGEEKEIHLFKVKNRNRLLANMANTGTAPSSDKERAGAEGEKVDNTPPDWGTDVEKRSHKKKE